MKQKIRVLMSSAVVAVALAASTVVVFAQWADYPTAGPRTPDGKIDLTAPPPRTADGKIDFSGLWEQARGPGRGGAQAKGAKGKGAPPPPPTAQRAANNDPPLGQFFNIGAGLEGGLPPLTPWARAGAGPAQRG